MPVCADVRQLCSTLQGLVTFRRRRPAKRRPQISEPFDFKREMTVLPGLTQDEISVLREKAAASCLGVADYDRHLYGDESPATTPDYHLPQLRASSSLDWIPISAMPTSYSTRLPSAASTTPLVAYHQQQQQQHYHHHTQPPSRSESVSTSASSTATPSSTGAGGRSLRSYKASGSLRTTTYSGSRSSNSKKTSIPRSKRVPLGTLTMPSAATVTGAGGSGLKSSSSSSSLIALPAMVSPLDLDDFHLGSPVTPISPLSGRGSPKSNRSGRTRYFA